MAKGDYVDPQQRIRTDRMPRTWQNQVTPRMSTHSVPLGTQAAPISPTAGFEPMTPAMAPGQSSFSSSFSAGGMGGINPSAIMQQYNDAYNRAYQGNMGRYNQGLRGYQDRYRRNMSYLEGAGQQELADIRQSGEDAKSANAQRLTDVGLSGTTVGASLDAGTDRETNNSLGRAEERIRQQRLSTDASLSGDTLGFIERRTDAYPEMESYLRMMQMAGQMAGRGSGGGSGAGVSDGMGAAAPAAMPGSQMPANYGASVINNDTGLRTPRYTRQPSGGMSTVYRTDEEERLARNPFLYGG